jgi:hypothetical protein
LPLPIGRQVYLRWATVSFNKQRGAHLVVCWLDSVILIRQAVCRLPVQGCGVSRSPLRLHANCPHLGCRTFGEESAAHLVLLQRILGELAGWELVRSCMCRSKRVVTVRLLLLLRTNAAIAASLHDL